MDEERKPLFLQLGNSDGVDGLSRHYSYWHKGLVGLLAFPQLPLSLLLSPSPPPSSLAATDLNPLYIFV